VFLLSWTVSWISYKAKELPYESKIVVLGTRCFGLTRAQISVQTMMKSISLHVGQSIARLRRSWCANRFHQKLFALFLERVKDARISRMPLASLESARVGQGTRWRWVIRWVIIYVVQERIVARFHQETNWKDAPGSAPPINCCRRIPPQPPHPEVSAELPPVTHRERTLINT